MIRKTLIEIKNRMQYLAGDVEVGHIRRPGDGIRRWNNDKNTLEEYDALRDKWVDMHRDYKGFSVP